MGKALGTLRRYPEALESFGRALSIDPKDEHALVGKASTFCGLGRHQAALATAERAVQLSPQSPDALACKGLALLSSGRVDLAEAVLQDAATVAPDHVHVLNLLGKCALARRAWSDAKKYLEHAVRLKPEFAGAHAHLCQVYYAEAIEANAHEDPDAPRHPLDKALEYARTATCLEPGNPEYVVNLGLAYAKIEQYDLAIEQFDQAVRLSPENGDAHLCLAHACFAVEYFSRALESGQRAAELGKPEGREIAQLANEQMKHGRRIGRSARSQDGPPPGPEISRPGGAAFPGKESPPEETVPDLDKTLLRPREGGSPRSERPEQSACARCSCGADNLEKNAFCGQCGKNLMN